MVIKLDKAVHKDWSRGHTYYFYEGKGGDLLDYAVMRGYQEEFLKLCTGVKNSPRPVDIILSGHVHKNWECRISWDETDKKFLVSHDFYTENPATYYHSYDTDMQPTESLPTFQNTINKTVLENFRNTRLRRIHVEVTDTARMNEVPVQGSSGVWSIKTKPYPQTLNGEQNRERKKWWWLNVRPLVIQTAALGPSEFLRAPERQPDFRGGRHISVEADIISKIQYVTLEKMNAYIAEADVFDPVIIHTGGVVLREE